MSLRSRVRRVVWAGLAQACARAGGPRFAPVDEETIAALHARYDLPEPFEEMLRLGYPEAPIELGYLRMFPSVKALLALPQEVPGWPRACIPIEKSGMNDVSLIRRGIEGIARLHVDDGEPGEPQVDDTWVSFDDLLAATLVLYTEIWEHSAASGRKVDCGLYRAWLPPEVVRGIVARLGLFQAEAALTFFGLDRTAGEVYRGMRSSSLQPVPALLLVGMVAIASSVVALGPGPTPLSMRLLFGALVLLSAPIVLFAAKDLCARLGEMRRFRALVGGDHGYRVPRVDAGVLRLDRRARPALREGMTAPMTVIYWIGGLVALALFAYLVLAMLKPEWLS